MSQATWSNYESELLNFHQTCLRAWLRRFEEECNTKLIARFEYGTLTIEHIVEGLLRADTAGRGNFYGQALAHGWMTVNEIRALENLAPIEGGDSARIPMNTAPLANGTNSNQEGTAA